SGSCASMASSTESLIWSAILSGWPSVTDSEVNRRCPMEVLSDGAKTGRWSHRLGRREQAADVVPDPVREGFLRPGVWSTGRFGVHQGDGVVVRPEHRAGRHVVHHDQVAALAS